MYQKIYGWTQDNHTQARFRHYGLKPTLRFINVS